MKSAWKKIDKHLATHEPDVADALRPPATAAAMAAAQALAVTLPEDLAASLAIHDGQNDETLFDLWRLLSTEELVAEWRQMTDLLRSGDFDTFETEPDKKVQAGWWRQGWVPVAADGYGNLLGVDTDPAPRGSVGQVIVFWHDEAARPVLASRLLGWMRQVARELPKQETTAQSAPVELVYDGAKRLFRNPKAAQIVAVRGETGPAEAALALFAARGDPEAAASMAILRAYQGDWNPVFDHAQAALAQEEAFYHINVPQELLALVARAAALTGQWERAAAIAAGAPKQVGPSARLLAESAKHREDRLNVSPPAAGTAAENAKRWADYQTKGVPSTYSKTEQTRRRHRFLMAVSYAQADEARRIVRAHPEACDLGDTPAVRQWLDDDEAWALMLDCLQRWYPVYQCQVAPSELLTDPRVRDLMGPERCLEVLQTPRVRWWWDFSRDPAA